MHYCLLTHGDTKHPQLTHNPNCISLAPSGLISFAGVKFPNPAQFKTLKTVSASLVITNLGPVAAKPGKLTVFFTDQTAAQTDQSCGAVGDVVVNVGGTLKYGKSKKAAFKIKTPAITGLYYIHAFADYECTTANDTNTVNNQAQSSFQVIA